MRFKNTELLLLLLFVLVFASCGGGNTVTTATSDSASGQLTVSEARAIAKEAYTYGFPLVDGYRIQHAYFVDKDNTEFRGAYNTLINTPRVYTPADKAVQTPNSDTPYSMIGLDLRTEPFVLTVPAIEKGRYFSIQLVDNYTQNFNYIGTRTTGNGGGKFLIAGPGWKGEIPKGITKVIQSETSLLMAIYRTQLFSAKDLDKVIKIQAGYTAEPLSAFLGQPAPKAAPAINFIKPLMREEEVSSLEFYNILNFQLQFCPTHPSETALMERFAKIKVGAGKNFDSTGFSPDIKEAIRDGISAAWADFNALNDSLNRKELSTGQLFGTREYLKNNYLYRMAGAVRGIFGNSIDEAMYMGYAVDSAGKPLGGAGKYTLRFAPGQLPPVNAFWSMTMYEMPASLLVDNPINRYLINSPMLTALKKDPDGGITLYIQHDHPGKTKEANWLPAPASPFAIVLRLYSPKQEALEGKWVQPSINKVM